MPRFLPLRYKLVGLNLFVLLVGMSAFSYYLRRVLVDDKKLFVMDLNLAVLDDSATSLHAELDKRLSDIKRLTSTLAATDPNTPISVDLTTAGGTLADELLSVAIYETTANGELQRTHNFNNLDLLGRRNFPKDSIIALSEKSPVGSAIFAEGHSLELLNRSLPVGPQLPKGLPILTLVLPARFVGREEGKALVVADVLQDFVTAALRKSSLSDLFLLSAKGALIANSNSELTVKYANEVFPHPVKNMIQSPYVRKGSTETSFNGKNYLVNVSDVGLNGFFLVSQIDSSVAFQSIRAIEYKGALVLAVIAYLLVIASYVFSKRISRNAETLKVASEALGSGDFDVKLDIHSRDEIQSVAESFSWMAGRLKQLMFETASKARMEGELKTASLVQSTLLKPTNLPPGLVSLDAHYLAASEIGGDFWDASIDRNILTVLIGDATGHGAAGAIVMAVAKACFSTLTGFEKTFFSAEEILRRLNSVIYKSCQGQLLMTMFILQLDLTTGDIIFANAGHEAPMLIRANTPSADKKTKVENLFTVGERLGFSPDSKYTVNRMKLELNDTVLFFTDGVSEAKNPAGKEWGERLLKKAFINYAKQSTAEIRDGIAKAVTEHTAAAPQQDDITFMVMRWDKMLARRIKNAA